MNMFSRGGSSNYAPRPDGEEQVQLDMSKRQKTHVFMAPSSLSAPDEESTSKSSHVSAAWTHVALSWQDGRLQTGLQLPLAKKATSGVQSVSALPEDECSASILEYLEGCFPQKEAEPVTAPTALSHHSQYLSTWTLSQALVLKGGQRSSSAITSNSPPRPLPRGSSTSNSSTPELFTPSKNAPAAPNADSPPPSAELFTTLSPSLGPEGCVLLQATVEGLLCSQAQEAHEPPSKRARLSNELETSADDKGPVEAGPTTALAQCVKSSALYSVLVAVVHPCHLKEIRLKSGTCIPLASIIVTDQSGVEMKVVLWRRTAFWVLTVSPGDVLLITELQINEDTWRGETVLRSTYNSKLLNMGRVPPPGTLTVSQQIKERSMRSLHEYLNKHRPLLVSLPVPPAQTPHRVLYGSLRSLRVNALVHMLLRVTHTHLSKEWQSEADSRYRAALERRAVVSVRQPGSQQGALVLWGAAVEWLPRFTRDTVWDFRNLLVREGTTFESPELHSTPWSSVNALDTSDPRISSFTDPHKASPAGSSSVELDLRTLLSQTYSGEVELRACVESFHFKPTLLSGDPPLILDRSSSAADALKLLSADVTYTGCGRCGAELDTDSNGIYCPCCPCLPHTTVRCYYRPAVLGLTDREQQIQTHVPSVLLQNILKAPPDKLSRSTAPGSALKHIELAAQRLSGLLCLPHRFFSVRIQSHFLCDENSVPLYKDFTLLDLQLPE